MGFLSFCSDSAKLWKLIGRVMLVFKIVIPLLLIIFGMIDLGKAVIASDEKAIKAATNSIIRRLIAAVVIFFIRINWMRIMIIRIAIILKITA